jgi:hypothetical protein
MSPQLIALVISLVEEAIKDTPALVEDLKAIFSNPNPSPADWEALRAKVLAKSYADYVPASALPANGVVAPLPSARTPQDSKNAPISQTGASAPAAVAPVEPYLADGSPNPAFNHLA